MNLSRIILEEIRHRRMNFTLSVISAMIAVACVVGAQVILRSDELETSRFLGEKRTEVEAAIAEREAAVKAAGADLQDAIRKQMKGLGFNVLIVPEKQDLAQLHLDGSLQETMPESYVDKLANSSIVTVNHLLPSVSQRIELTHDGRQVEALLVGTRGEVPIMHRSLKKPLLDAVPKGTLVVGYEIHQALDLELDETVTVLGQPFVVKKLHPQRGSSDDVTIWIDLGQAQELLDMQNVIHAILALECECAGDRISQIRAEIESILPGTKVVERYSTALARAEARGKAKETAEQALAEERASGAQRLQQEEQVRREIENRHASLAMVLVPLVLIGCAVWIGLLAWGNVRQRASEIGILRAVGLGTRHVLILFLARAVVTGLLGGILGGVLGLIVGMAWGSLPVSAASGRLVLASTSVLGLVLLVPILAPFFSALASWLPAVAAAQQDPALILQRD